MRWAFFKCVKIALVAIVLGAIATTNTQAWSLDVSPDFRLSDVKDTNSKPCFGNYAFISVSGEGSTNACVMGQSTRVASYATPEGSINYAISFPYTTVFYRLDICAGILSCVYAEENDTFASPTAIYKNFTGNLVKSIQQGITHYSLKETYVRFNTSKVGALTMIGKSVAISHNGKWVLAEMQNYGVFQINTDTFRMRRVVAPGFTYGLGGDPRLDMAISNDGKTIAIMGLGMSIWVVAIDDTCGNEANEYMQTYYTGAVTPCRFLSTPPDKYITSLWYALTPRFTHDSNSLSFDVYSGNLQIKPRHVTLFSQPQTSQTALGYVALGDSFTSGEGETTDSYYIGGPTNLCHVSRRSYPFLLASAWGYSVSSSACSGATMATARGGGDNTTQPAQLLELESRSPQVATVGIGGNDAGLVGKLKDCLGVFTCKWASSPTERWATAVEIKNLYPHLQSFYKDIKARTTGTVIAIGYPRIISAEPVCSSPIGALLDKTERTFMNESIHYLNQVIQAAAADSGIKYADIEDVFDGDALCVSVTSAYMNDIRFGDDFPNIAALPMLKVIGSESFHPKPEGHALMAQKIFQAFANPGLPDACPSCTTATPAPSPSSYWSSTGAGSSLQKAIQFISKHSIKKGDTFEISLPAFSFKPLSDVVLEAHSDVKKLGVVQASEDGSLRASINSKDIEPGYHSIHASGQNYAENAIDLYDFIAIEEENTSPTVPIVVSSGNSDSRSIFIPVATPGQISAVSITAPPAHPITTAGFKNIFEVPISAVSQNAPALRSAIQEKPVVHTQKSKNIFVTILLIGLGLTAVLVAIGLFIYTLIRKKKP